MDNNQLFKEIEKAFPGATLQIQKFGKGAGARPCIWIEARRVADVARSLKADFNLDLLENFSVMQVDEALVATYFISSFRSSAERDDTLVLRASVSLSGKNSVPELPSVSEIWEMASPLEEEAAELFGITFVDSAGRRNEIRSTRLAPGWEGFPLRKDYAFPTEVDGVRHERGWPAEAGMTMSDGEMAGENGPV